MFLVSALFLTLRAKSVDKAPCALTSNGTDPLGEVPAPIWVEVVGPTTVKDPVIPADPV